MEFTPEFEKKMKIKIRDDVEEVLKEVAVEITEKVRAYVARSLYSRPESLYYERDRDNGGFLETFVNAKNASSMLDSMLRVQQGRMYITFVLRDYENLNYEGAFKGTFGHHASFDGEETNNSRFSSEMDNFIDKGWTIIIHKKDKELRKKIKGIHFKDYAQKIIRTEGVPLIYEKLRQRGYQSSLGGLTIGRKRISLPIDEIKIGVKED